MKFLAKFSVKNSLIVNVLSVFIVIAGIVSIFQMHREAFPSIDLDHVTIVTVYPAATPVEIEKLITIPIEKELKEIDEIEELTSISAEGISRIMIDLEEGIKNKIQVITDIQRAADRAEGLPEDLPEKPIVTEHKTKNSPVIEISLSGDMSEKELRALAKDLEKQLETLPDVSQITKDGYRESEIWVEITPESVQKNHISFREITEALQRQNQTIPGGRFYDQNREFILRTVSEFQTAEDVKHTVVRASAVGNWITIEDIAKVTDTFEEENIIQKTLGTRSINLVIVKREKGDAIRLADQAKSLVEDFKKRAPETLDVSYINDMSFFIKRRLNVLKNNGAIGLILVAVSLFAFLSLSTALGACLGLPIALLFSFTLMNIFGISINLISLFALIMVLGMLVDEDIVISENIHRHIEKGLSPEEAAITGSNEVNSAVIATVLTTIAAFIPLFFMGGTMGKFSRIIPIVVILTLIASLMEALFILPSHISDLSHVIKKRFGKRKIKRKAQKFFDKLLVRYDKILRHTIQHRYLYSGGLLFVFLASLFLAIHSMDFVLFPSRGVEIFFVRGETNPGDSLEVTAQKFKAIEKVIAKLPKEELDTYTTEIGIMQRDSNDPQTDVGSSLGQIVIYLTPEPDRDRNTQEIIASLREQTKTITGFQKLRFDMFRHGPPVGAPVEIQIRGDKFEILKDIADQYKKTLATIPGVIDIDDDFDDGKAEKHIVIDPIKAAQTGLTVGDIAKTVRDAFDGIEATQIITPEEEIDIVAKFPIAYRNDWQALETLLVANDQGRLIPLNQVASLKDTKGLHVIKHIDNLRAITVTANVDENITTSVAVNQTLKEKFSHLTPHKGYVVRFGGEIKDTQESLHNLFIAFTLSAFLIILILITMFRSLVQPLVVMVTIPFSIIGVILAFKIHGMSLSFMAILGLIGLTGIVVDGAIIMIDFINRYIAEGMDQIEAIIEGSKIRFRAVVLITLTTVVGVLPAAYGLGGSDPFIIPMALALNYGILFSTFLTLIYIPIFLVILVDIRKQLKSLLRLQNHT